MFKRSLLLVLLVGSVLAGCTLTRPTPVPGATLIPGQGQLKIAFLDVGQGDSILIQAPNGQTMLIDGGRSTDLAQTVIIPQLRAWGAKQVDVLVVTHPDQDHIAGLVGVLEDFPVKLAALTGQVHSTKIYERLLTAIRDKSIAALQVRTGTVIPFDSAVKVEVLGPDDKAVQDDDTNDASIVIKLTYGNVSFLLTGDAELPENKAILGHGFDVRSSVLKLGHHGSRTSTNEDWLQRVQPQLGIISAGKDNSFGHPHPEVIAALEKLKIQYIRTDEHGTITVVTDGMTLHVTSTK
ncbi:MAG TPA: ComEC/Rec2 family competence protein [Anaerolineae bacterium]|nr:ComEC/Rec2 family competence protein [Anaerolineae bacterium]